MNRLRQFCAATVLTLSIALTVFAGDMATGVAQLPPPPPQAVSAIGDVNCGCTVTNEESTETSLVDPVTEFTLNILQSFLSLF
jgi:hypothetical protein